MRLKLGRFRELLKDLGRDDDAAASFENAIARGADPQLNRYYLASLTGRDVPVAAPRHYVQTLFDGYADGFDDHLVRVLGPRRVARRPCHAGLDPASISRPHGLRVKPAISPCT